ncbi:MAG: hypothetical protein AABY49_05375 [Planctomycetota bacterium]
MSKHILFKKTEPQSVSNNPAIMRSNVVLPQPLGPRMKNNSFFSTDKLILSQAIVEWYFLEIFTIDIPISQLDIIE